jgi:hypothetical protein
MPKQEQHVSTYLPNVVIVEGTTQLLLDSALRYDRPDNA